jgi:hypothetical protein
MRRVMLAVIALGCLAGSALAQPTPAIDLPKATIFPGATNPEITPDNIKDNICNKAWTTRSIRPSTTYTNALKSEQIKNLGYSVANEIPRVPTKSGKTTRPDITKCVEQSSNPACYEEDHLISLELGGNPRSPDNLWPEPWFGTWNAGVKDRLEGKLNRMVCNGEITLGEAQQAIAKDWIVAYKKYVGEQPPENQSERIVSVSR